MQITEYLLRNPNIYLPEKWDLVHLTKDDFLINNFNYYYSNMETNISKNKVYISTPKIHK